MSGRVFGRVQLHVKVDDVASLHFEELKIRKILRKMGKLRRKVRTTCKQSGTCSHSGAWGHEKDEILVKNGNFGLKISKLALKTAILD
jgi:hypothetical protein